MSKPFGGQADSPLREMFPLGMAVLDEIPTDDTGHVTACGYEDPDGDCGCSDLLSRIEAAIHEHFNPPREKRPGDECYSHKVGDVTYIVHTGDCSLAGKTTAPNGKVVDL